MVKQSITEEMFYLPPSKPTGFFFQSKTKACFEAELCHNWLHISVSLRQTFPTGKCLTRKPCESLALKEWVSLPRDGDLPGQDTRILWLGYIRTLTSHCGTFAEALLSFLSAVPLMQRSPLFLWSASPNSMFPQSLIVLRELRQPALSEAIFHDKQNNNMQKLLINGTSLRREGITSVLSHFLLIQRLSRSKRPRPPPRQC